MEAIDYTMIAGVLIAIGCLTPLVCFMYYAAKAFITISLMLFGIDPDKTDKKK